MELNGNILRDISFFFSGGKGREKKWHISEIKKEELTGYQASGDFRPSVDLQCDFVMVYGIDDTMPDRIRQYREKDM